MARHDSLIKQFLQDVSLLSSSRDGAHNSEVHDEDEDGETDAVGEELQDCSREAASILPCARYRGSASACNLAWTGGSCRVKIVPEKFWVTIF